MCPEEMKFKMDKCKFFCMTVDKTKTKLNLQMDTFAHFLHFPAKSGLDFGFPISCLFLIIPLFDCSFLLYFIMDTKRCMSLCVLVQVCACLHAYNCDYAAQPILKPVFVLFSLST